MYDAAIMSFMVIFLLSPADCHQPNPASNCSGSNCDSSNEALIQQDGNKPTKNQALNPAAANHTASNQASDCLGGNCGDGGHVGTYQVKLLQNITSTFASLVPKLTDAIRNPVRIELNQVYPNTSCGATAPDARLRSDDAGVDSRDEIVAASPPKIARDCNDIAEQGHNLSGVYTIQPRSYPLGRRRQPAVPIDVYCDMDTDKGPWTVFQRREDGSVEFYRNWADYKFGFGHLTSEHWLGLDRLHKITSQARYELRVDIRGFNDDLMYALYDNFRIGDEATFFKLILGAYRGTAGDSLSKHRDMGFTTKDQDHDVAPWSNFNCAVTHKGAWWYKDCHRSNLNGVYMGANASSHEGIVWFTYKTNLDVLQWTEMKIRRKD